MVGVSSLRTFQSAHANHRTYHWFLPQLEDFLGGRHIPITGLITILLPQPEDFLRMHTNHRIYHKKTCLNLRTFRSWPVTWPGRHKSPAGFLNTSALLESHS